MRLDSALELKQQLIADLITPSAARVNRLRASGARAVAASMLTGSRGERIGFGIGSRPPETLPVVQRTIALGVARHGRAYRLAIRVQRPSLLSSCLLDDCRKTARGEVDIRLVGRVDKRAKKRRRMARPTPAQVAPTPWYQQNTRPLLIGASVGHVDVTAGTLGAFLRRGTAMHILSNNHVLANENAAKVGDWVLQRASYDGGRHPAEDVAHLRYFVRLKPSGSNFVDAALASLEGGIEHDPQRLRGIVNGRDRRLAGAAAASADEGDTVYKIGRTTGATRGRVSAFALDNLVVNYDAGNLRFDDQIEIEAAGQTPFSDGGDSGSLIVNTAMEAYALLFAGSEMGGRGNLGVTFANPIQRVLRDLKAMV